MLVYTNLIRRFFKNTVPIVLGGIEASLRRVVHYDYWSNSLRRSILFDAKADYLLYGMAEGAVLALAGRLARGAEVSDLAGLCYISKDPPAENSNCLELPSFEEVSADKDAFTQMFHTFYRNNDPLNANGLYQQYGDRYLIHNPPASYNTQSELDEVYALPYQRAQHPYYEETGSCQSAGDDPLFDQFSSRLLRRMQLLRDRRPRGAQGALAQPGVHPGRSRKS